MKKILLLIFTILFSICIFGQTGPGGVGNSDGASGQPENVIWFIADSLSLSDTDPVALWNDLSGNTNNAEQATGSLQPEFRTAQINGLSTVFFDGLEYLSVPDADNLDNTTGVTVIVVAKPATTDGNPRGLVSKRDAAGSQEAYYLFNHTNNYLYFNAGSQRINGNVAATTDAQIFSATFDGSISNPRSKVYNNGDESGEGNGPASIGDMSSDLHIGILNPGYAQGFDGDIAEVIVFRNTLNDAQLQIVNQYINVKYGITITNDFFNPDASYLTSIAGIGEAANGEHSLTTSDGLYLEALSGLNDGDYLFASHNNFPNDTSSYTSDDVTGSVELRYNRIWFLEKTNTPATRLSFDFSEASLDAQNPVNPSNYVLLYRNALTGNFSVVKNADGVQNGDQVYFVLSETDIETGYYTLGTEDQLESPLSGDEGRTWYTLISGDWDDWEVWTLDPSGSLPNNPDHLTPTTSPTSNADNVVILTGKTVTVNSDDKENNKITIDGRLDFQSTSGHSFGEIKGRGRILLSGDYFPGGDASHFISEGQGEGTVEYYGTSFDLNQSLEFYDLTIDMDDAAQTLTLLADYTINGNLRIKQGELQFNDNTSTTNLNISISGDVNVESNGKILTGTANARHQLNLYGDFTNQGTAEFTNRVAADYSNEATDGIVDVNFLNASKNQRIYCAGITNFYRIEIDKGTDDTYELSIESTDPANFNLFGYANQGHGSTAQLTDNDNALGLVRGTVRINNNVNIPVLNNSSGNYNISEAAQLWVDGGYAAKPTGTAIVPYGKIRVSSGTLEARINSGITTRENGLIKVEGGTVDVNQIRTSVYGESHVGGYNQSGGTVNVYGGNSNADWYVFNLTYGGNVFIMSGGTLHIHEAHGKGGIFIASDEANQNVTGGTVIMDINDGNDFEITSKAPFWNVIIRNSSGGSGEHILSDGIDVGGTDEELLAQDLVVFNDLTIETNASFDANEKDVYIGRNFTIEDDALYEFHENATVFNGTEDGILYVGDITSLSNPTYTDPEGADPYADWEQPFYGFTIEKPDGVSLTLQTGCTYDAGNTGEVKSGGCKNIYDWRSNLVKVTGPFILESGYFDIDEFSVRLYDEITNKGIFGLSGMPKNALIKLRKESSPATRIVNTTDDAQFGNLRLNSGAGIIEFTSDVYVKRMEYRHGRLDIGTHNLKIDTLVFSLAGGEVVSNDFSVEDMIIMDGNASDGGLSLYVPQVNNPGLDDTVAGTPSFNPTVYFFPIGTGTTGTYPGSRYTPANIRLESVSDDGYVTVNIVSSQLQTAGPHPLGNDVLNKYFRIRTEGFSTPPKVERYRLHVTEADIPDGTNDDEMVDDGSQTWNPGYVLDNDPYTRTYEINDDATGSSGFQDNGAQDIRIFYWGNEGSGNPVGGFDLIEANYTAGLSSKFSGAPTVYYSRRNSGWGGYDWDNNTSWYDAPTGTNNPPDYPTAGDIAVIRGNDGQDGINVSGTQEAAEVIMQREGTYTDIEDLPRLRFQPNDELTAGKISGVGDLYLQQDIGNGPTLNADIGEFAANDTSLIEFYLLSDNGTYNVDLVDFFDVLPTLRVYGNNANYNRIVSFNYDMSLKNLIVDGEAIMKMAGNYTVENRTRLGFTGGGRIEYPNGTDAYTLKTGEFVTGRGKNQQDNDFRVTVDGGGGNDIEHTFEVERDINLNFPGTVGGEGTVTFDLFSATGDNNVILKLSGTGDNSFIDNYSPGNSTIELYKIEMNKGSDTTSTFTFEDYFTLNGPTSGAGVDKALELQNGKLILNDPDVNVDLTTGDDDFYIPSSAGLEIRQGQANANGGSGILLDGKLQVSGGTVDMSGGDNYIQYSASGNATLEISDGDLIVGSHIRRGLTSGEGVLNYNQSGGNVIVGNDAAPENNRALFEIVNTGSEFNHTGGNLIIGRAQNNPTIASLYLDPENYIFGGDANIQFGYTNTPAGDEMGIYANIPLPNVILDNTNGSNQTLKQWTVPLTITDSLEIDAGTTYDANGLDLTLQGDLIVNGDFVANSNTTIFSSTVNQQIVGSPVFYNLTKNASGTLNLNSDITIENELNATNGVIADNSNDITVMDNVYFDATHQWGGAGNGILLEGTITQNLYATGTLGKLSINNSEGIFVPEGYTIFIDDALQLESGVLDIGKNLLELDEDAVIIEANAFSENNMIQTNISFTDAGVKKLYPAIVPADNFNFTYPIGSEGKYTPVDFEISEMDAGGYIRVRGANEMHPTIINDDEPCQEIHDTSNVLKYHWLLEASGATNFTGTANMKYYNEDYQLDNSKTGTSYTVSDYITARLLLGSSLWNKFGPDSFDENNQLLTFNFTNTDDDGISGEYTAGIEDQAGTCEGAIPDEVPSYISIKDGDWTDVSTWDTYPVSGGSIPAGGPRGAIVIVEHHVTVPKNYIVSYKTAINNSGLLDIGTTFGHRLGIVDGTGTLKLQRGSLPAGVYDDFFSRSGGTIEFAGNTDYDVLSEVSNVRNIIFSGTGERRLPNLDFEVYGVFAIDGDDATLEVINEHDRIITLDSNLVFTQGSFDAGVGTSEVIMNGTSNQTITGDFTGSNAFWNFEVNNPAGLTLAGNIEIDRELEITSGIITSGASSMLTVNYSSTTAVTGYNATNYIDGPMQKLINSGESFIFPIGDDNRYGRLVVSNTTGSAAIWEAEYYDYNPDFHTPQLDTANRESGLEMVSGNEFWRITGPAGSTARNTIRWDANSILPAMSSDADRENNLKMVEWISANTQWEIVSPATVNDGGFSSGTISSDNNLNMDGDHYFTFGTTETSPLPTAGFITTDTTICDGSTITLRVQVTGNPDFEIEVDDGSTINTYAGSSSPIIFDVTPGTTTTYEIISVTEDTDGSSGGPISSTTTITGDPVTVTVLPVPDNTFSITPTGADSYCEGSTGIEVGLDGSELDITYQLLLDGSATGSPVGGTGSPISFGNQTAAGTYTVEGTHDSDASGTCSELMNGTFTLSIDPLPMAIDQTDSICSEVAGETAQATFDLTSYEPAINNEGGVTYEWYEDAGLTTAVADPSNVTINDNFGGSSSLVENYFCLVINSTTSCEDVATVEITILRVPETGPQYHISNNWAF